MFLVAHPNIKKSILNKKIVKRIHDKNKGEEKIIIRNLYNIYPDFKVKVNEEIKILFNVEFIVFQFPFYWYSYPSLLKEWKDKVFTKLYNDGKNFLSGKHLLVSITSGAEENSFHAGSRNNFTIDEFLRPIQQTAFVLNMIYHGYVHISMNSLNNNDIKNHSYVLEKHADKIIFKINQYLSFYKN
ncbi:NAD(P)H-dependent oxidoreductase [Blattabacterium cuenoti]|uniref:NAD(P)H-dependent oxidoreductase n=1 Tax=Blattabacterium cuenoti TaxID=1653831 RepID=UPI001EECB01B|nr:NAD(P)H-dependent oxidoreductase [Blattabacterium cuenoti]